MCECVSVCVCVCVSVWVWVCGSGGGGVCVCGECEECEREMAEQHRQYVEKQREEVKTLMLSSTDEDMTTQLVLRILGEGALPLKADHTQVELATPKLVVSVRWVAAKKLSNHFVFLSRDAGC